MRKQVCDALVARSADPRMVFLTGDLGFMALEPLQAALGKRFINAGVAEQNMVSVAAALARQGLEVWVYSIAPFLYARAFEQVRNDIAFHGLPVKLIGNGGGYGYGVMGPTHHAIEDYGVLLTLPDMTVYAPAFDEDVAAVLERAGAARGPCFVRLGRGEPPAGHAIPAYAAWRQLTDGLGPVLVAVGPLAGTYIQPCLELPHAVRPRLWVVAEMSAEATSPPSALLAQIQATQRLVVAEEHVAQGGFASRLLLQLASQGAVPGAFTHLHARAHHYERYGSQGYLRRQSGLDPVNMLAALDRA